jgi:CRISPR-associated endonuclease/helicase Cas3
MIIAKSDGSTLSAHIDACLLVWQALRYTVPELPLVAGSPNFFELLFAAVYIHDFGKAQKEFQKKITGKHNLWENQRHEIYSVPFVEKFDLVDADKTLLQKAVLAHHKDYEQLFLEKYKDPELLQFEFDNKWRDLGCQHHPQDFSANLQKHFLISDLQELITAYPRYLGQFDLQRPQCTRRVVFAEQKNPISQFAAEPELYPVDKPEYLLNLLFWGSLKVCDHYGSAGIRSIPILAPRHFTFLNDMRVKLVNYGRDFYTHQIQCMETKGNGLLIAPTGSGKTEAAIGWLSSQLHQQGRAFYILPFTASINAMHRRLTKAMDGETCDFSRIVGIVHGNLPAYLASLLDDLGDIDKTTMRNQRIASIKKQMAWMLHPLKIATPFQLLKFFFGVKGFEMGLVQLVGAKLIFDEIHAYDPTTFAQIMVMLDFVINRMNGSVLIMTATLPSFMIRELEQTLHVAAPIRADRALCAGLVRHEIIKWDAAAADAVSLAIDHKDKKVLFVCNTVRQAQTIYLEVLATLDMPADQVTLLHGRFTARDRMAKEEALYNGQTTFLIGTQTVEVSLDIDFDLLITEPAPLDALLQRFGRVNRKGLKSPCPIYVLAHSGEFDHYIYPREIVRRTLQILPDRALVDETKTQEWLDCVYPDWLPEEKEEYERTVRWFTQSLKMLQPYSDPKELEAEYDERFTGIRVLPAVFWEEHKALLEDYDYVGADQLYVTIQRGLYFQLLKHPQGTRIEKRMIDFVDRNERIDRRRILVAKCRYSSALGLTDDFFDLEDSRMI